MSRLQPSTDRIWEHVLVRVVDESPFVEEAIWEKEDEGYALVTAYPQDGCVRLYFKRPAR